MRIIFLPVACALCFISTTGSFARPRELPFQHLTSAQGLSQNAVLSIVQDSAGYLWFGTVDGLNRYDGFTFTIFKNDLSDSLSLSSSFIKKIVVDHEGNLWIGTIDGLNRFDRTTETFTRYKHDPANSQSLSGNDIVALYESRDHVLWVGARNAGLNSYDPHTGQFIRFNPDTGKVTPSVFSIFEDRSGVLWAGTSAGLFSMNPGAGTFRPHFIEAQQPGDRTVTALCEDRTGILWIGSLTGGLLRFDKVNEQFLRYDVQPGNPDGITAHRVWSIRQDRTGTLWIGTENGLNVIDPGTGKFTSYKNNPDNPLSLSNNHVLSIFEDRSGVLWVGTLNGGINKYDHRAERFPLISHQTNSPNSLSNNAIWSFLVDHSGTLWVGTEGGLNRFDSLNEIWSAFKHDERNPTSISNDLVTSLYEDRVGRLWAGTRGGGLNLFDRKTSTFTRFQYDARDPHSLSVNSVIASLEDTQGRLWFGTDGGGLNRLVSPGNFLRYRFSPDDAHSLSNDIVGVLYEDRSGRLWVGTFGGGLNRMEMGSESFTCYRHVPTDRRTLSNDIVTSIYGDTSGTLWIGTTKGLNCFNPSTETFIHYFEKDGLPNDFIYGILPDDHGNIWLSTNKGVVRFSVRNLTQKEDSASLRRRFTSFDVADGLQGNEFNSGAYYRSAGGEMFFGGSNGFNRFFAGRVRTNSSVPPVVLTSFRRLNSIETFGKPLSALQHITLAYTDYFFSFEFAALDYTEPEKNQFQYLMEGFDREWVASGTRRFVTYTNLDPGEYVFRVKASNNDGLWGTGGFSIPLTIHPPFWRTWWFMSLSAALAGLILYVLYRYRVNQLLAMERLRIRLASDLHDDLATNLSSIGMFGEILQRSGENDPQERLQFLDRITSLARESASSIRDIIWAIDPKPETLHGLFLRAREAARASCAANKIDLRFELPDKSSFSSANLSPETRRDLSLLLKEAINNAIKHSHCTELAIDTDVRSGILTIVVTDNGSGFDITQSPKGRGLGTIKSRGEKVGSLRIRSSAEEGTTITISAKL